jgi:hypothetical protein
MKNSSEPPMIVLQFDPHFVPLQIMGYLSIINATLQEAMNDDPTNEHQWSVREGLCYLAWHTEDLMRAYLDSEKRRDDLDEGGLHGN